MNPPFPSPTLPAASRAEVFVRYLDYFRERVADKVAALSEPDAWSSRLPSGWTPVQLVKHLRYVELRWIEWGFQGRDVGDPWGDQAQGRWHVAAGETREGLLAALRAQGRHTRTVVETTDLGATGVPGPRWEGAEPATLERVLFHLIQEYARHLGHLDVVAELAGGLTGE